MDWVPIVVAVVVGGVLGFAACVFGLRGRLLAADQRAREAETKLEAKDKELAVVTAEKARLEERAARVEALEKAREEIETRERAGVVELNSRIAELREQIAQNETQLAERERAIGEQRELLKQAETQLKDAFDALSAKSLKASGEQFLQLATEQLKQFTKGAEGDLEKRQQAIESLVKPIGETLQKYEKSLQELEVKREKAYTSIDDQVKRMVESQEALGREARTLSSALKNPSARGRWAEMQLRRIVEMSGMLKHCDFAEQESKEGEEGKLRPDVIVNVPGGRRIVIDAKAPGDAYFKALETDSDDERRKLYAEHARLVRGHMKALGNKAYWKTFDEQADFVVMYLPGEPMLIAAMDSDPELIAAGLDQSVMVATPTTLMVMLRAYSLGWRQEQMNANALEVQKLGNELHERIGKLLSYMSSVGLHLGRTLNAYNQMVGSVEGRVLPTTRKLKELGAAAGSELEDVAPINESPRALIAPELDARKPQSALELEN